MANSSANTICLVLALTILIFSQYLHAVTAQEQQCGEKYHVCVQKAATSQDLPDVGSSLSTLYTDLIAAVNAQGPAGPAINLMARQDSVVAFCCAQTSQCLLLNEFNIQFCWDRFTTNFAFPDGSYGNLVAGNLTLASGTRVDLVYGDFVSPNGATGNIYDGASSDSPNTSTMAIPSQWTSSGVGSAIPPTELGSMTTVSFTSSLSDTTISAITATSLTITAGPSACTRCIGGYPPLTTPIYTTAPPATSATLSSHNTASTSGASVVIPPFINGGTKRDGSLTNIGIWLVVLGMDYYLSI